jgi:porin-like protein
MRRPLAPIVGLDRVCGSTGRGGDRSGEPSRSDERTKSSAGPGLAGALASCAAAAGFAVAASAAELPTMRAPPPRPARACNVGGMNGYVIPGTSTCVRISGYVSAGVEAGNARGVSYGAGGAHN